MTKDTTAQIQETELNEVNGGWDITFGDVVVLKAPDKRGIITRADEGGGPHVKGIVVTSGIE